MSRTTGCLVVAWTCLSPGVPAMPATAQEPQEDAVARERQDVLLLEPDVVDPDDDGAVERAIYGTQGPGKVREESRTALTQHIKRFDKEYGLTPTQKKKLELAGRGDIKRFFDRVEDVKADYRRANNDLNRVADQVAELETMHHQTWRLFGEGSLLVKTLRTNLTFEQISRADKTVYRERVEWMAGLLHSRLVLGADQRSRLVDLVVEETPPLMHYGDFDYDAIMFQMSRLPREKLQAILDEGQCRELALRFEQARRMESVLVSGGYLFRKSGAAATSRHEEARR